MWITQSALLYDTGPPAGDGTTLQSLSKKMTYRLVSLQADLLEAFSQLRNCGQMGGQKLFSPGEGTLV